MKPTKRSPLKDKPLRNPGQSLEEQRLDLAYDKLVGPFMMAAFMVWMAVWEWWRYFSPSKPQPVAMTVAALVMVVYAAWQGWKAWPKLRQLRLAIDGEKAVGQFLERLRTDGYQVFHDVMGPSFNIDHILIGRAGVFTIETKTRSKPERGDPRITFDGERILVDGREPDRDPVIQAKAQAGWLKTLLAESTGKQFPVRPVVVFPGWFIQQTAGSTREVWVLEPKALRHFLNREPEAMPEEDCRLATFHLSRFVRSREKCDHKS